MLSYRSRSGLEIETDLEKRGFPAEIVNGVVNDLSEKGWLDDGRLAEEIISYGQDRNKGTTRIYADLRKRGISRQLAEESLERFYDEDKAMLSLRRLAEESLSGYSSSPSEIELNAMIRHISRRGFSHLSAREAIIEASRNRGWL